MRASRTPLAAGLGTAMLGAALPATTLSGGEVDLDATTGEVLRTEWGD